jgi:hypothetical protein
MKGPPTGEIMVGEATEVDKTAAQKGQLILEPAIVRDRA